MKCFIQLVGGLGQRFWLRHRKYATKAPNIGKYELLSIVSWCLTALLLIKVRIILTYQIAFYISADNLSLNPFVMRF